MQKLGKYRRYRTSSHEDIPSYLIYLALFQDFSSHLRMLLEKSVGADYNDPRDLSSSKGIVLDKKSTNINHQQNNCVGVSQLNSLLIYSAEMLVLNLCDSLTLRVQETIL
jgi:hypothetical protein